MEHVASIFRAKVSKQETNVKKVASWATWLFGSFFDREDADMFLQNVG
jgi:hypothetical protein